MPGKSFIRFMNCKYILSFRDTLFMVSFDEQLLILIKSNYQSSSFLDLYLLQDHGDIFRSFPKILSFTFRSTV